MCTGTVAFRSAKRQVAGMMRSASARFVETNFDPGLPQRVLWFNFRRLGFCNLSDFSSLGVGVEDFVDYFVNVLVSSVQIPTALEHIGGFLFRHIDLAECFSTFESIISNAVGAASISVKFFKLLLPLFCCHVLHVLCGRWLLFPSGPSDFRPLELFLFYLKRLNAFSMIRC
jgi:hypothetical protein